MGKFVGILAILLCLAALWLPFQVNDWLRDRQASAQAATVLVLIIITAYYAILLSPAGRG